MESRTVVVGKGGVLSRKNRVIQEGKNIYETRSPIQIKFMPIGLHELCN